MYVCAFVLDITLRDHKLANFLRPVNAPDPRDAMRLELMSLSGHTRNWEQYQTYITLLQILHFSEASECAGFERRDRV